MRIPPASRRVAPMLGLVVAAALVSGACAGDGAAAPVGPAAAPSLSLGGVLAARVELLPVAFTLKPGAQRALIPITIYADGRQVRSDTAVRYAVLDSSIATVSATGVVVARTLGATSIIGTVDGRADTSLVTVTTNPVATVTLSPATLTLATGRSAVVTYTLRDANGLALTDRAVSWTSSNPAAVALGGSGSTGIDVIAKGAGGADIVATSEGRSGSMRVTVPATGPVTAECASPKTGWVWCDDFEADRRAQYFERDSAGGRFVRASTVGANGSFGMRARFDSGTVSAGSLKLAFGRTPSAYFKAVDAGTANYREIYWRWYVRYEPTWTGGGGDKMSRATVFAGSNWSQAMIAHVWSGGNASTNPYLVLDPASGTDAAGTVMTTKYNDFDRLRWLGAVQGARALFTGPALGSWQCVEAHVKLNDASTSNGVFETWVNGTLDAQRTGLNWLGSYSAHGLNAVFLENYWNAGSPKRQERYFDNLVVSTTRIGC